MPTRSGSSTKPSSYTFSGTGDWANMEAGHIFSDDSAGTTPDITGNGIDLVLQGTAAISAVGGIRGDCLDPGNSGAIVNPPVGWDSWTSWTAVALVRVDDNLNGSGASEGILGLDNSGGAQDTLRFYWKTSEDVQALVEDSDSGANTAVADGFINNAAEWATVAAVMDGTAQTLDVYVIVDGDATQSSQATSTGVTGSTTIDTLGVGVAVAGQDPWHGLIEADYFFSEAKTQVEIEAMHVDPYGWNVTGTTYTITGDITAPFTVTGTPTYLPGSGTLTTIVGDLDVMTTVDSTMTSLILPNTLYPIVGNISTTVTPNSSIGLSGTFTTTGDVSLSLTMSGAGGGLYYPQTTTHSEILSWGGKILGGTSLVRTPFVTRRYTRGTQPPAESVLNGNFDSDATSWTADTTIYTSSIAHDTGDGGRLKVTNNGVGQFGGAYQAIATVIGGNYIGSTVHTAGTAATGSMHAKDATVGGTLLDSSTTGTGGMSIEFTATSTTTVILLQNGTNVNTEYGYYDKVTVKRL